MENSTFKAKKIVMPLAWTSLILGILCFLDLFITYYWDNVTDPFPKMLIRFPQFGTFIVELIALFSTVILFLYFKKWFPIRKNLSLFSVAVGLIALYYLLKALSYITFTINAIPIPRLIVALIVDLIVAIMLVVMLINPFDGKYKNVNIIIIAIIALLLSIIAIINRGQSFQYDIRFGYGYHYSLLRKGIIYTLYQITLFVTLLIFLLNNKVTDSRFAKYLKAKNNYSPAQELRNLTDKFNNGIISEEEYNKARAEIISRL